MSLLSLLVLLSIGPPQDLLPSQNLQAASQDYMGGVPQFSNLRGRGPMFLLDRNQIDNIQSDNTCFAIRSYIFRREDGQAPVLAGTTTCTPASTLRQKRVGHHRARLVLLNSVSPD